MVLRINWEQIETSLRIQGQRKERGGKTCAYVWTRLSVCFVYTSKTNVCFCVCMWMHWLINQQTSVITWRSGWEVSTKRCLLGLRERERWRGSASVSLTAVELTLTLMSRFAHEVTRCADKWCDLALSWVKGSSSSTKSHLCPQFLLVKLTKSWRCILSRVFSGLRSVLNISCAFLTPISSLNFLWQMLDAHFTHTSLDGAVFCLPKRMSFLKGYTMVTCNYGLLLLLCDV